VWDKSAAVLRASLPLCKFGADNIQGRFDCRPAVFGKNGIKGFVAPPAAARRKIKQAQGTELFT